MRKNPLLPVTCGVCMGTYPETEVEFQFRYGDPPWYCCHACLDAGKEWSKRKERPEAVFAPAGRAPEPGLFDTLEEE